jgi:hypothetical protein
MDGGMAELTGDECVVGLAGDEGMVRLGGGQGQGEAGASAQWDMGDRGVTCDLWP